MTKVIILGEQPKEEKKLKAIEFVKILDLGGGIVDVGGSKVGRPDWWGNVMLLAKRKAFNMDMIYAWHTDDPLSGSLFLGHFNDGVVE